MGRALQPFVGVVPVERRLIVAPIEIRKGRFGSEALVDASQTPHVLR